MSVRDVLGNKLLWIVNFEEFKKFLKTNENT